jgi:hypothetical protein
MILQVTKETFSTRCWAPVGGALGSFAWWEIFGYECRTGTRSSVPRFAWCRRDKWDGLDLDGLDDARARQPKTGNWAHPRHFRRQVSRAGGRAVTSHESDFANERCDADAEDFQGGRIAQARGGRSSGAQAAGVTSSGGGALPVRF